MNTLETNVTQESREEFKNKAVEVREKGNLQEALEMFEQVVDWDEKNNNLRGKVDVLGHIRITYNRLGEESENEEDRKRYAKKAVEIAEEAVKASKENPEEIPEGSRAVMQVHLASAMKNYAEFLNAEEKSYQLEKALKSIKEAIKDLPGSEAHKAWPSNPLANILYELGETEKALEALKQGEKYLFTGYEEEINNDDQAELKLNVWLSGLHLTMGKICAEEGKGILAKHYASSVVNISDPKDMLGERKKEAQRILNKLK